MNGILIWPLLAALGVGLGVTVGSNSMKPEPDFWAFVEIVEYEEVGMFGLIQENKFTSIEVNEPKTISDVVDLSGYSSYEILSCHWDTCSGGIEADHVLENKERIKVVVSFT